MLTRREVLKGLILFPLALQALAHGEVPAAAPRRQQQPEPQPWQFPLAFPASFAETQPLRRPRRRMFLPDVRSGV